MAASPRIPASVANAMLDAGIGSVTNAGKVRVYSGTQPAVGGGALSGNTLLLEFLLDADAFPAAAGGVLTANPVAAAVGLANATATWFRIVRSDGTTVAYDGSVGEAGSLCDLIIDAAAISIGDVCAITSLTITQPLA